MAADVALDPQPPNPCCAELKKRYLKLEEKRNALRQAVKLLENQTNKLQEENNVLKKVCEKECTRADLAQRVKEKESEIKHTLEKEILHLKSEIALLQEERSQLRETCILQGNEEIKRLNELLKKEIKKGDSEKKKLLEEKKKAAESWKLVKIEKSKVEEEKRIAESERKKTEDLRHCLAKSKSEVSEAREQLNGERSKADAAKNKVELEKQRANKEKKRADSERAKVEEQMRLVEIEKGKLMNEKTRADNLSEKLEEERQKREELQKEMEEIWSTGQGVKNCLQSFKAKQGSSCGKDLESANMKLLKGKLKLQKDQLKHAKRMSKLEEAEKRLLCQQLYLLKEDHTQFSHRLEMLVNCFSYDMEGIECLAKVDGALKQCAKQRAIKPRRKIVSAEHDFNSQIETGKDNNDCSTLEYQGPIIPCTWRFPNKCGRRSTKPISGISSDLESPVGDSVRDKSQNSAICSTAVTYSDAQVMGSQGRSAFAIATSAKLAKENLQGSPSLKLTGKKAKKLPVVQQNNDASVFHRKMECLNSIVCNGMEVVQSDSQCVSGKREDHGILNPDLSDDSDTRNYEFCMKKKPSKRQKLCLQPSDQIDYHNDAYGCKVDGHDESCFVNEPDATGHTLTCRNRSSDVIMNEQITSVCLENIISEDYMKLLDFDDDADEERYRAARERPLSPTLPELESPRLWHSTDNCHTFAYGVSRGKCELENEKLVSIIESNGPNSHSLPSSQDQVDSNLIPGKISPGHTSEEIDMASILNSSLDSSQLLLDRCLHVGSGDTVAVANETCHSFRTCHASDLGLIKNVNERRGEPCDQVDSEHTILDDNREKKIALDIENDLSIDKGASQIDVIWESRSSMKMETVKKISLSKLKELKCVSEVNGHEHLGAYGCCAVFSYTKDEQVISRIFSTRNAIMHDTSWGCETGFLIAMVLHALAVKLDLSAEEKVCVFFSLLLCKISTMVPVDHATYMAGDLPPELEMFISEMDRGYYLNPRFQYSESVHNDGEVIQGTIDVIRRLSRSAADRVDAEREMESYRLRIGTYADPDMQYAVSRLSPVISDAETRSLFIATCELDIFVSLIQNFLTARKVMICEDTLCEPSNLCTTDNVYCLDNGTRNWSLRTAAINELIAACTILASISTILDRIDILWQTSFQLLQRCKGDSYWILTAVHVFASLCGMKFFSPANQNLIVAAIKSLVQLLERGKESGSVDSNGDKGPRFSVCTKCPFAEGEVCVDKVTSQLLGELRRCTVHATRHPDPKQLVNVSYDDLRACINKSDGHDSREIQFDIPSKEFDAFCSLHNFVHPLDQNADKVCCHFTDIVSLVELFGYYMGWECLYSKIIQQLFTLLESCASSAFSVSLLVLIGQLGRIGIESGDCGDRDIEGVMCSLLTFLDMSGTGKSSLPIQFAAVETLLNLLSLDFRDIVDASSMISLEASRVAVVEHVRRWFYQLGEKQKAVSLGLFHKGDMKKSSYF